MAGCDVHEIPDINEEPVAFSLHLDFDTDLPFYEEIAYSRSVHETKALGTHDVRYVVKAYREEGDSRFSRVAHDTFIFTSSDIHNLNRTLQLALPEGNYIFKVWVDYIDKGTTADKYYDTGDFSEIILADRTNHPGSNDYRDAFRGYASGTVTNPNYYVGDATNNIVNEATAYMQRPMGKFKFISTDVEIFLTRVVQMMKDKGMLKAPSLIDFSNKVAFENLLKEIKLNEFEVVFRYNIFMPCSFNMFADRPADSWTGMSFTSRMHTENYEEMNLGFDYIFVNGSETILSVTVEVYNKEGELISSSKPVNVPIVRSKLTVVKGEFLTSKATGGVSINPGFDGEDYNVEIK
jgi:hypothetical protein